MQVEEAWTGLGITEAFRQCMDSDPNVVAVTQDSYKLIGFTDEDKEKYGKTDQFFDVGVAEQNMSVFPRPCQGRIYADHQRLCYIRHWPRL